MKAVNKENMDVYIHFGKEQDLQKFFDEELDYQKNKAVASRDSVDQQRASGAAQLLMELLANIKKVKT